MALLSAQTEVWGIPVLIQSTEEHNKTGIRDRVDATVTAVIRRLVGICVRIVVRVITVGRAVETEP